MFSYILIVLISIISLWTLGYHSKKSLHILQLEGYKSNQYKQWISDNKSRAFNPVAKSGEIKKPLVMTDRAKRLFSMIMGINGLLMAAFLTVFILITGSPILYGVLLVFFVACIGILYIVQPYITMIANILMEPVEKNINNGFYRSAQKKVQQYEDLIVVGITGSFGKTSTKFISNAIAGGAFNSRTTPSSYNTPMGISKVINNEVLPEDEVFIVEMGARNPGDIKELCQLVHPSIGVLTSIGPTHLETFKNIETIMKTKYELIESLPVDGVGIFNYDNEYVKKLADKTAKKKMLYGLNYSEKLDLYADDIEVYELGTSFTIYEKNGNSVKCTTKLLGKHNISNILAGACVGKALGMSLEQIANIIPSIEPIEHRLNIINPGTGIIIIDDAFNSNPVGAKAALETLGQFNSGKRIIVTPGMVELGEDEYKENYIFGQEISKVCDVAILVGEKRTQPIREGLLKMGFPEKSLIVVNSLNEASDKIAELAVPGDVILFENDLPDTYSEV
ncbi:MAG: UDP-N-acetylmuramoyl-tripeptide--D-alanyl-D-alanine ligase [Tissierellia bacterium]|nr:UDP-N-acetylmuramoyl-tripeptide--D-alanyl-D-alanine ligase [Tissierellia bacterium]